ncbi:MAG: T9SS type A sorting domain-containing protein [Bacteroidetes bacterium]|nr:T9SS type A sorting domain-containing protein [Bacteroidota bacterium]
MARKALPQKYIAYALLAVGVLAQLSSGQAQQLVRNQLSPDASEYFYPDASIKSFRVRDGVQMNADNLFTQYRTLFGLSADDAMVPGRVETDASGVTHYRFTQEYRGVPLEHISYNLHEIDGALRMGNGKIVLGMAQNAAPTLRPEQVIPLAIAAVPAQRYAWEDAEREATWKRKHNDQNASRYPKPELLFMRPDPNSDHVAENYVLAYKVAVMALEPYQTEWVYLDAHSGALIHQESAIMTCAAGSVNTTFNGTRTVYTSGSFPNYVSVDDCIDGTLYSYDNNWGSPVLLFDADNSWASTPTTRRMVMTSLWAARETNDYYDAVHGLNGFDGAGDFIEIYNNVEFGGDCGGCNASWDGVNDNMNIGTGASGFDNLDDYNTLDIVGHEFTHGVIEESTVIDYNGESGAINEFFADFFGNMAEFYAEGGTITDARWRVGEDRQNADGGSWFLRDMSKPKRRANPDTFEGSYWTYDVGDNSTYVHRNSGVGGYALYLMSQGNSLDTNDNGHIYSISGLGHTVAQAIAYDVMRYYADADPTYEDIRESFLFAANLTYGSCSNEAIVVGQAWQAVGVGVNNSEYETAACGTYGATFLPQNVDAINTVWNRNYSVISGWGSGCTTTIDDVAPVTFHSADNVQLYPGFHATAGSRFTAYILPCDITDYRLAAPAADSPQFPGEGDLTSGQGLPQGQVALRPNPTSGPTQLLLENSAGLSGQVTVFNNLGQVALKAQVVAEGTATTLNMDLSGQPEGLYLVEIRLGDTVRMEKLVKQ